MNTNNYKNCLKLLSIFHYIIGGILAFLSLFILNSAIKQMSITNLESLDPLVQHFIHRSITIGIISSAFLGVLAIATVISGRFLVIHKGYWFSFIVACNLCLFMPFGMILGVLTMIILTRKSVKKLYFFH